MNDVVNLKYIQDALRFIGRNPNKKLGQNFIIDGAISKSITDSLKINLNDNVLEIGSGLGSLSHYLVENDNKLTFCEFDQYLYSFLLIQFCKYENVSLINKDILKTNVCGYEKVVGNLPYYITTDIISYVLTHDPDLKIFVCMIQKEAYPRLSAKVGEDNYGPLSIYISYIGKIQKLFLVSKNCFFPRPTVDSLVFRIETNDNYDFNKGVKLYSLCKEMFKNPRKTILNNLSTYLSSKSRANLLLQDFGVNPNKRPEELSLTFYLKLLEYVVV